MRVGNSTLTQLSSRLKLDADLPLTASSPAAAVELADLLRLFGDYPPLASLTSLEGTAGFQGWELAGSAADPQTWEIRSSGSVRKLNLTSELLPGPVRVDQAPFVWEGRNIRTQGWTLAIGGSRMDVTSAGLDWTGAPLLDLAASRVDASVEDLLWFLSSRPDLAAHLEPFAPLSGTAALRNAQSRVAFPPAGARVDVSASLDSAQITSRRVPEPMRLDSGRLRWQESSLEVNDLNVALGTSDVRRLSLAFDWGAGDRYEIRADAAAIECGEVYPWLALLPGLRGLREDISGIQGNVEVAGFGLSGRISDPLNWNLHADSRLNHMVITTTFLEEPIRIRLGNLKAEETATGASGGTVLRVEDLQTSTGSNRVMASGEIRLAPEDIALDLTLTAESIDWNEIQTLSDRLSRRRPTEGRPVKGRIGLHAEAFKIGSYDFHPLVAEAVLTPGGTTVAIERADLCGIVLIGRLTFASGRLNAYIVPVADSTLLDTHAHLPLRGEIHGLRPLQPQRGAPGQRAAGRVPEGAHRQHRGYFRGWPFPALQPVRQDPQPDQLHGNLPRHAPRPDRRGAGIQAHETLGRIPRRQAHCQQLDPQRPQPLDGGPRRDQPGRGHAAISSSWCRRSRPWTASSTPYRACAGSSAAAWWRSPWKPGAICPTPMSSPWPRRRWPRASWICWGAPYCCRCISFNR